MQDLSAYLDKQRQHDLYRRRRVVESPQGPRMQVDGRSLLTFCSNDYLGLANEPGVIDAFKKAADQYGVGSGAAHLVNGHTTEHHALEEELADFVGRERALLFSTGYMANMAAVSALTGRHSTVFGDRLNHASLNDAVKCSEAQHVRYSHADVNAVAGRMASCNTDDRLLITDGVFSMDGDFAPLAELLPVCKSHNSAVMVDDAHGLGVVGEQGRGTLSYFDCNDDVDVLVGTLGKAFGTSGAFIAASEEIIETLIQKARTYIFTTAMPSAVAAATRASLALVRDDEARRQRLHARIKQFRSGMADLQMPLMESQTAIQPLVLGDASSAVQMSDALLEKNILVTAMRPPTVPANTSRLRFTLSASHTEDDVNQLLDALASIQ